MRNKYILCIVSIILLVWIIYFLNHAKIEEPFTPRIRAFYRPHVRNITQYYDYIQNEYGLPVIMNKLRKWNIY